MVGSTTGPHHFFIPSQGGAGLTRKPDKRNSVPFAGFRKPQRIVPSRAEPEDVVQFHSAAPKRVRRSTAGIQITVEVILSRGDRHNERSASHLFARPPRWRCARHRPPRIHAKTTHGRASGPVCRAPAPVLGSETLLTCPCFDQCSVHGEMFIRHVRLRSFQHPLEK